MTNLSFRLSVCQQDYTNITGQNSMKTSKKIGFGPTYIPFNFDSDPDRLLDAKKYQRSGFSHLLIIRPFLKKYTCLSGGLYSLSALVLF